MATSTGRAERLTTVKKEGTHGNDVRLEDQENINRFSRLNSRLQELKGKIAASSRLIEDLEEAGNEAMLVDDEVVPYAVGECFVRLDREEVEGRLESRLEGVKEAMEGLESEKEKIEGEMQELKAGLYVRFGDTIHLEYE
jgi:prefoldin subunit 4